MKCLYKGNMDLLQYFQIGSVTNIQKQIYFIPISFQTLLICDDNALNALTCLLQLIPFIPNSTAMFNVALILQFCFEVISKLPC